MAETSDPAALRQRRLVISGYVIQMVMYAIAPMGMPYLVLVPLIYIVIVRRGPYRSIGSARMPTGSW